MSGEVKTTVPTAVLFHQILPDGSERKLNATAAYDFRGGEPDYGCHGMEFAFLLRRGDLAVVWCFHTSWYLPSARKDLPFGPNGLGTVSYHSKSKLSEHDSTAAEHCCWIDSPCYSDSTYTASGELFEAFLLSPSSVWEKLEVWWELWRKQGEEYEVSMYDG